MFKITETFKKDDNALNLVDLLNKYIKSVLIKNQHIANLNIKYYTLNGFDCYTKKKGVINV